MVEIAKWYFKLYGPAALEDFVWWTGLGVGVCRSAFAGIKVKGGRGGERGIGGVKEEVDR